MSVQAGHALYPSAITCSRALAASAVTRGGVDQEPEGRVRTDVPERTAQRRRARLRECERGVHLGAIGGDFPSLQRQACSEHLPRPSGRLLQPCADADGERRVRGDRRRGQFPNVASDLGWFSVAHTIRPQLERGGGTLLWPC